MAKTQIMSIQDFLSPQQKKPQRIPKRDQLLLLGFGTSVMVLSLVAHDTLIAFDPSQAFSHAIQIYFPHVGIPTLSSLSDNGYQHVISRKFDESIWPIFVDIGVTIGTVSAGMGVYRIIRGDVTEGAKLFSRAGVGTFLLYMIRPAFELITAIGEQFANGFHP